MISDTKSISRTPVILWTGRTLSFLPALFLLLDAAMKLVKPDVVVKATVELGFPEGVIVGLGKFIPLVR